MLLLLTLLGISLAAIAQTSPIRIACVGNSITEGYGLQHRETEAYPAVLQQLLGNEYKVMNFGLSGHTLMNKTDRPYMNPPKGKRRCFQEALASNPDIVTIKLGTNDSKTFNWEANQQDFIPNLNAMIDSFLLLPSRPFIYLCLPIPADGEQWNIRDSVIVNEICPRICRVARERGIPVIDLYKLMKPYPELLQDKIHPTRGGAMIIAQEIARRIETDRLKGLIHYGQQVAEETEVEQTPETIIPEKKSKGKKRRK